MKTKHQEQFVNPALLNSLGLTCIVKEVSSSEGEIHIDWDGEPTKQDLDKIETILPKAHYKKFKEKDGKWEEQV